MNKARKIRKPKSASQSTGTRWLRFGIPSLDRLFHQKGRMFDAGINLRPPNLDGKNKTKGKNIEQPLDQHVSLCIQGPSGTGKSVMGLHLASRYWADSLDWERNQKNIKKPDTLSPSPRILYLSTDLGIKRAKSIWSSFHLNKPNGRKLPFNELPPKAFEMISNWKVDLEAYKQQNFDGLAKYLNLTQDRPTKGKVAFLDLAESTAGDDWGFITRVISLLPQPDPEGPHHLLIIDAVEGLEMLTGDTDAYGQTRSRRSRIAQILRAAAGKCHIVLILEEEDSVYQHPAEEYVTDIVMRLRVSKEENYYRRSLDVVKARGQTHIRGEHDYVIRQGQTTKGMQRAKEEEKPWLVFPDDPRLKISYVHVLRSLHSLSRVLMYDDQETDFKRQPVTGLALMPTPRFGAILPSKMVEGIRHTPKFEHRHTYSGLHRGRVTSLIGDEATLKSRLGRAFLAGAFAPELIRQAKQQLEAAVLITTFNTAHPDLKKKLGCHWEKLGKAANKKELRRQKTELETAQENMNSLLICRQLEVHHLDSSHLFHIIRRCIERALAQLEVHETKTPIKPGSATEENKRSWCGFSKRAKYVRVVIDDWSLIQSTHPEIAADKLFLPFLIKYFQRVGVTALIISTQPGRPEEVLKGTPEQPLRALTDYHMYTWHVPFYGSDRVAITAMPPMGKDLPPSVGELRNPTLEEVPDKEGLDGEQSERLWLDNHFELYKGVDKNDPQPVPLEVHLFSGADGFADYSKPLSGILNRLFTPLRDGEVLVPENHAQYAELRDFLSFHGNIHYDHGIVIQLDEYWKKIGPEGAAERLGNEMATKFLLQKTYDILNNSKSAPVHDPFSLYQPPITRKKSRNLKNEQNQYQKREFFVPDSYGPNWWQKVSGIPYQWDFGFLLLKKNAWTEISPQPNSSAAEKKEIRNIENVFKNLTLGKKPVSWHNFFEACVQVSQLNNRPGSETLLPFDLDTRGPQSFACLVLEIWASEIKLIFPELHSKAFPKLRNVGRVKNDIGLYEMLGGTPEDAHHMCYRLALFRSWMLLAEVLDVKSLTTDITRLAARPATHTSVAERQWYSTGSLAWKEIGGNNPVVPARLPGCGTVRGDWFLMVGKESRSQRLAERAIDLLCRRRRNQDRLELGLGLPMRRLNDAAWIKKSKPSKAYIELLTAMATYEPAGRRRLVRYGELLKLGCNGKNNEFQWLWRSRLKGYHHDDRVWEKWLGRILVEACKHNSRLRSEHHAPPFEAYKVVKEHFEGFGKKSIWKLKPSGNLIPEKKTSREKNAIAIAINIAWKKFNTRCGSLVSELR